MQGITAVLIGGPNDLHKMKLSGFNPEIRVMLAASPEAFARDLGRDTLTVAVKYREAIYRASTRVHPVHGGEVMIYVYDGERE